MSIITWFPGGLLFNIVWVYHLPSNHYRNFQEGRCTVRRFADVYVHLRLNGTAPYKARYRYAGDYRDGIAAVQRADGQHTHLNLEGDLVHGIWFLDLGVFHKGYACARDEGGWHHIDVQGHALYLQRFAAVEPFYNG